METNLDGRSSWAGLGIAFLWSSGKISGAEKRLLATVEEINARGGRAITVLERRDFRRLGPLNHPYVVVFDMPLVSKLLRLIQLVPFVRARRFFRRILRVPGFIHLDRLLRSHGVSVAHVSMSMELPCIVPVPAVFEVTSPDWADRVLVQADFLPDAMPINAVSSAVRTRLARNAHGKLRPILLNPGLFPNLVPADVGNVRFSEKENVIVFAHRLVPRKNGAMFAMAAKEFVRTRENWRVLICGRGPESQFIASLLRSQIRSGQISLGFDPHLEETLRKSKVFVSLIEPSNFPSQSVHEAMAFGNAVVLSDSGAESKTFVDGNGLLVALDVDSITRALLDITANEASLQNMGRRSSDLAFSRFSRNETLHHLQTVLRELASMQT